MPASEWNDFIDHAITARNNLGASRETQVYPASRYASMQARQANEAIRILKGIGVNSYLPDTVDSGDAITTSFFAKLEAAYNRLHSIYDWSN